MHSTKVKELLLFKKILKWGCGWKIDVNKAACWNKRSDRDNNGNKKTEGDPIKWKIYY